MTDICFKTDAFPFTKAKAFMFYFQFQRPREYGDKLNGPPHMHLRLPLSPRIYIHVIDTETLGAIPRKNNIVPDPCITYDGIDIR